MVYAYGRKRKASSRMGFSSKKPRRMAPSRIVRPVSAAATVVKKSLYGNWAFATASTSGYWRYLEFKAIDVPEWSQYEAVFDEYRVTKLNYEFRPKYNSYDAYDESAGGFHGHGVPCMHLIPDPASGTFPAGAYNVTTENAMLESGIVRTYEALKPFSISFRPKIAQGVLGGGTAAMFKNATWIRTGDDGAVHTGLHAFIKNHNFNAVQQHSFDIYVTATMEFRGAK